MSYLDFDGEQFGRDQVRVVVLGGPPDLALGTFWAEPQTAAQWEAVFDADQAALHRWRDWPNASGGLRVGVVADLSGAVDPAGQTTDTGRYTALVTWLLVSALSRSALLPSTERVGPVEPVVVLEGGPRGWAPSYWTRHTDQQTPPEPGDVHDHAADRGDTDGHTDGETDAGTDGGLAGDAGGQESADERLDQAVTTAQYGAGLFIPTAVRLFVLITGADHPLDSRIVAQANRVYQADCGVLILHLTAPAPGPRVRDVPARRVARDASPQALLDDHHAEHLLGRHGSPRDPAAEDPVPGSVTLRLDATAPIPARRVVSAALEAMRRAGQDRRRELRTTDEPGSTRTGR